MINWVLRAVIELPDGTVDYREPHEIRFINE